MYRRVGLAICCWFSLCPLRLVGETSLEQRLAPLAKAHKGKVAIAVKNLKTGESYYLNAKTPMPTASMCKLAVMIEVYQQVAEGKVKLTDMITLRQADKVPGSGILTNHFSEGASMPLKDAVRLMMVFSDNTATNLVLDKIGIGATARRMEAWGYPNTRINAKVYRGDTTSIDPARTKRYGLGSSTAREMMELCEKLQQGKLVSPAACKEMLEHLKKCDDKERFTRFLPANVVMAHKPGAVNDIRTDAGILYLKNGPVALCVMTEANEDRTWRLDNAGNLLCARVAREVYQLFAKDEK